MKRIGILGSGIVGQTLALGFEKHGYSVMIGSRTKDKLNEWKNTSGFNGSVGTFEQTSEFGDTLVLAVKGHIAIEVLKSIENNISNKTIIDATNPIDEKNPQVNGVISFFTGSESLMEKLQSTFSTANFVKAFNSIGSHFMVNPDFDGIKPSMFICGNDEDAKKEVIEICTKFGFDPEDMGSTKSAGTIENLCILWCLPGMLRNEWTHAFKLLKK